MASHGKFERGKNGIGKAKFHYEKESGKILDIEVDVDLSRFQRQFSRAQFDLDSMIMNSMQPFMPMQAGPFIQVTRGISAALAGTGTVCAAAPPMGRFLYEGKTMVDIETGSPWARKGAKKVLVSQYSGKTNASENLTYGRTGATDHWFDAAKKKDGKAWVKKVKKVAGGG